MFCIGTLYALSTLQSQLPRLLSTSPSLSLFPFAAASLGLSLGVSICAALLSQHGSRLVLATGTTLWGLGVIAAKHALARSSLAGILVAFGIGGIGVGLTYLGVVVVVGESFPKQPLARSAVGPLGFSSGTAACIVASILFDFDALALEELGNVLVTGGVGIVTVGVLTLVLVPSHGPKDLSRRSAARRDSSQVFFSTLLFFNALPGMTIFAALLPLASVFGQDEAIHVLPYTMAALALGGLLAPRVSLLLGPKLTFSALLLARGAVLLFLSWSPSPATGFICLLTVLFAHGTGFSVIPGLLKARQLEPEHFVYSYGRVLMVWGLSGVCGVGINAALGSTYEGMRVMSRVVGLAALVSGGGLQLSNVSV